MRITTAFDSGNIEVLDASDPDAVRLRIRPDPPCEEKGVVQRFAQWFHFRVDGARGTALTLHIEDADKAAYTGGWPDYRACVSTDRRTWRRAATTYDGKTLTIRHTPDGDACWFAYFAPYDLTRVADTVAAAASSPFAALRPIGTTLDGRSLDRLIIGTGERVLWIMARQHPGESMASWWMEGFLARLLDPDDALAARLRAAATFHVVPHMNPDGSFRGHLRTNAAGANLNREWAAPTAQHSPEVLHTLAAMDATGVDFCLDVHGDEALPYTFISGAEGIPGWTDAMAAGQKAFCDAYERANPDFQQQHGYPVSSPGTGNLTMATNAVAQRYGCLSMTLEMPFKDNADRPDPEYGWSPARCIRMGAAALDAIAAVTP